eukprot:CAMPEP_0197641488 /NCGR_PEP_ID=MMETSP1338-20131121/15446_1 /TAXON_ID=43686 ORGANISM="Pelagodinium beii, Strain RCC1491" /NCGR_SAMPLE_ID=MMETSP1338 /ASSEMBLY_ACC=CAM_ASM_000754 /LENGTH=236 /DNA_ID=CAMNT_0043214487 /DNA_START=230 /DNA_END=940 /DNA_ORIENTATION=-
MAFAAIHPELTELRTASWWEELVPEIVSLLAVVTGLLSLFWVLRRRATLSAAPELSQLPLSQHLGRISEQSYRSPSAQREYSSAAQHSLAEVAAMQLNFQDEEDPSQDYWPAAGVGFRPSPEVHHFDESSAGHGSDGQVAAVQLNFQDREDLSQDYRPAAGVGSSPSPEVHQGEELSHGSDGQSSCSQPHSWRHPFQMEDNNDGESALAKEIRRRQSEVSPSSPGLGSVLPKLAGD